MAKVLADTSVIIEFFRPGGREEVRQELGRLLDEGRLAVCGMVVAELLQGVRIQEKEPLQALLEETEYLELQRHDFEAAGNTCNRLRKKGFKMAISDALIASLCQRLNLPLFTLDSDYGHIENLRLHQTK